MPYPYATDAVQEQVDEPEEQADQEPEPEQEATEEAGEADEAAPVLTAEEVAVRCELALAVLTELEGEEADEITEAVAGLREIRADALAQAEDPEGEEVTLVTLDQGTANTEALICLEEIQQYRQRVGKAGGSLDGPFKIVITYSVESSGDRGLAITSTVKMVPPAHSLKGIGTAILGEDGVLRGSPPVLDEEPEPSTPTLPGIEEGTEAEDEPDSEDAPDPGGADADGEAEQPTSEDEGDE